MKYLYILVIGSVILTYQAQAQLMNKLKDKVKQTVDRVVDKPVEKPPTKENAPSAPNNTESNKNTGTDLSLYGNYDFVPGDSVLFSDDLQEDELEEIPMRWIMDRGRAEVTERDGVKMISARLGTTLRPRMSTPSYLPARFTIEFDMRHLNFDARYGRAVTLALSQPALDKNQDAGVFASNLIKIWADGEASFMQAEGKWPGTTSVVHDLAAQAIMKEWKHIAISVNERSIKVYINQHRILNAPYEFGKPSSVAFTIDNDYEAPVQIRNFRIMTGGKTPAKQVTTESVYIARGIQFEKASAKLLPESMGEINSLVKLMKESPALKFEIGGHTSAEGGDAAAAANQQLSEQRANTVRSKMIDMGIDASRLQAKGYGQHKPIGKNDTPEGRATNRRVEFVKL